MVRTVVMTVLHAAGQTAVSLVRADFPESLGMVRAATLALLVAAGVAWGAVDGWLRREGSAPTWLTVALVTGPITVTLAVLARAMFIDATGTEVIGPALLSGAAFTALLVLIPAAAGVGAGRLMTAPPSRRREVSEQC